MPSIFFNKHEAMPSTANGFIFYKYGFAYHAAKWTLNIHLCYGPVLD